LNQQAVEGKATNVDAMKITHVVLIIALFFAGSWGGYEYYGRVYLRTPPPWRSPFRGRFFNYDKWEILGHHLNPEKEQCPSPLP
jgi:hypothetical protein